MIGNPKTEQHWAFSHQAEPWLADVLGQIPGRWGRMTALSRLLVVEAGKLLQAHDLLLPGERLVDKSLHVGLVGGTRYGSLDVDKSFITTMQLGPGLASPALFGYTLPNIALAEVAVHWGLTGPVYALFETRDPLEAAAKEATLLLGADQSLDLMLACEFDAHCGEAQGLAVTFTLFARDEDRYPGIPQMG